MTRSWSNLEKSKGQSLRTNEPFFRDIFIKQDFLSSTCSLLRLGWCHQKKIAHLSLQVTNVVRVHDPIDAGHRGIGSSPHPPVHHLLLLDDVGEALNLPVRASIVLHQKLTENKIFDAVKQLFPAGRKVKSAPQILFQAASADFLLMVHMAS